MACHLFLGGDREQLFEEQMLPEQPNTSSCVRLAESPELSPCSCGRQGRNRGRRQQTSYPHKDLSSSFVWDGQTQLSEACSCFCDGEGQPQEWPSEAPGSAITVIIAGGGIYQKWHKNQEFGTCLQSLNHLTLDTLSGTSIQSIFSLLPAKQINAIFWPSQRGRTQKGINMFHY